eukprot:TRINITY_DN450_c0_g1_i6.p4 TRINITY_DN450_c0_g1~~TRINITY_DN450_c0_g1_i6.p4  ORF type:complete len:114 (-),score=7.41 TRINITY_DN450_c0_g1_i6:213-554(-)
MLNLSMAVLLLFIGYNTIGYEGAKEIGFALQKNNTLTKLNLSMAVLLLFIGENKIGDEGAKGIGVGLQQNNALIKLSLGTPFACYQCQTLQRKIILEAKEQRKLDFHCRRTMH